MMEMKYPSLEQFIKTNFDFNDKTTVDQSFNLIAACIDKIYNDEEVWAAADCSKKELTDFLEQMNSQQFKKIENFFTTMPKLSHEVTIVNPKTKKKEHCSSGGIVQFFA